MINSKDILAKLLATENLSVVHKNVKTASFNVADRVLTLPIWENMEDFTYDHLVGHEVGHALYTPTEGWHESVSEKGAEFKSFLNVIEDARIEKLIQRKYPGLRRNFVKSYTKMLDEGFFGDDIDGLNRLGLIDRINCYFKLGRSAGIRIEADELSWVNEIEAAETWEEVVDIAERMYGKAKADAEKEQEAMRADNGDSDDEMELDDEYDYSDDDADDWGDDDADGDGNVESETEETDDDSGTDSVKGAGNDSNVGSKTDEALRDNINNEFDDSNVTEVYNLTNNYYNANTVGRYIVGYKEVLKDFHNMDEAEFRDTGRKILAGRYEGQYEDEASKLYTEFMANNKKTIAYLVKEFEMKKSAAEYARATVAKTGVIDPVKMNNYKFSEDIFRKISVVPEGKNHGMIMYLDWSGSMANDMFNTIEQTLNLVYFCRQVGIPFRVYAFTSQWLALGQERVDYAQLINAVPADNLFTQESFRLIEFFNNKMNKQQLARMSKILLLLGKRMYDTHLAYRLGGTPLDDALGMAPAVYDLFQKTNRVDIVNTIFLTDGDSHSPYYVEGGEQFNRLTELGYTFGWTKTTETRLVSITDVVTKKRYRLRRNQVTKTLLKLYSERTGSNVIGFRIMSCGKNVALREFQWQGMTYSDAANTWEGMKKDKYVSITGSGYDKMFILKGGRALEMSNGSFEVASDAKKGAIASAFKKANKSKLVSRSLLNEFIKEVA